MKRRPPRSTRTDTPALHDALPIYIPRATITLRLTQPWTLPQAMLLLRDDPARLHFGQWLFSRGDAPGHTSDDASASLLHIVISDASALQDHDRARVVAAVIEQIREQTQRLAPLPALQGYEAIVEKRAPFAAQPGQPRPHNHTPYPH